MLRRNKQIMEVPCIKSAMWLINNSFNISRLEFKFFFTERKKVENYCDNFPASSIHLPTCMNVIMLNSENDFFHLNVLTIPLSPQTQSHCKVHGKNSQLHLMQQRTRKELFSILLIALYFNDLHPEQQFFPRCRSI